MIDLSKLPDAIKGYGSAVEFAAVEALTKTAKLCQDAARKSLRENFTLRNKWTEKSIAITPARKEDKNPFAEIYVRDKYIAEHEEGATRTPQEGGKPIPSEIRELANIPEGKVIPKSWRASSIIDKKKEALKKNKPFVQTVKKTKGVWVREAGTETGKRGNEIKKRNILLLYVLELDPYRVRKKKWYIPPINYTYDSQLEPEYNKAVDKAIERWKQRYL